MAINFRSHDEIEKLRAANQIVVAAHKRLSSILKPGVSTISLDREAEKVIRDMGGIPSFKGYRGFPNTLCVAINDVVVHGIPDKKVVREGDIIGLDLGVEYQGYFGDAAQTLPVGEISDEARNLLKVTKEALMKGIEAIRPGGRLSDISNAVQTHAENAGYSVVTAFVGHGIGTKPHEDPQVPNFGPPGRGPVMRNGMVLAIEPMVNIGGSDVEVLEDNWTVQTIDSALSAHFEHSVAVVDDGYDILSDFGREK
ncbi:Methionine aminopeptidase [hydrothermal vent metagenome]|uniref:Methionine aminopeptidase n=1 Tax=hydrothermal vent metagenome TaxID=652676 RepID=A0A3B1BZT8_9ZZZZ